MPIIDHRGFSPLPSSLTLLTLDASLASDLQWEQEVSAPHILWELDFSITQLSPPHLASHQLAVKHFVETVWEAHQEKTLGVILYKGKKPLFPLEAFAEYLHHLAALLPDEVPPFALFDCPGDPLHFSKEIFPHIHLGFRHSPFGILEWGETFRPLRYDMSLGVLLPLREKGVAFEMLQKRLASVQVPYRMIAEPYLTEEWDELDELIVFPDLISPWGLRMVQGFEAAGGKVTYNKESG